jgi:hypothetical protein
VEYHASSELDWRTWYDTADNVPFDFSKGPLVQFCVISRENENTEIIILSHHSAGDGIGYLDLVKDLLLTLDNRIDATPHIPPAESADTYFKGTVLLEQAAKDYAQWLNGEWRKGRFRTHSGRAGAAPSRRGQTSAAIFARKPSLQRLFFRFSPPHAAFIRVSPPRHTGNTLKFALFSPFS